MTGTSQAAPHVSGVVAQYLEREPYATEEDVIEHLLSTAAEGYIKDTKACTSLHNIICTSPLSYVLFPRMWMTLNLLHTRIDTTMPLAEFGAEMDVDVLFRGVQTYCCKLISAP